MGAALRAARSFCTIKRRTTWEEKELAEGACAVPPSANTAALLSTDKRTKCEPRNDAVPPSANTAALLSPDRSTKGEPRSDVESERSPLKIEGGDVAHSIHAQDVCWPVIGVQSRLQGCGGSLYADSATSPRALCYVGSSGLQFGRFDAGSAQNDTAISVCLAALEECSKKGRQSRPFWYLERSLIGPLRGAIKARFGNHIQLRESANEMGMLVLPHDARLKAESNLPESCMLRNLRDEDAMQVNLESGPGPNRMDRARTGCCGIEVSGILKGWAVRGADGAIGMLKVDQGWRQRGLATVIIRQISDELRSNGLPCFAYVRDDNLPSRKTFFKVGYERVADVKFCFLQFA